jgi:acyl carrier protein
VALSEDFAARVMKVIAETQHLPLEKVAPDATFEQLGIDSLDGINIVFALENEFDISIPDDAIKTIKSVPDVIQGVQQLVEQKAAS